MIKRLLLLLITCTLIVSLAAPAGAAFAMPIEPDEETVGRVEVTSETIDNVDGDAEISGIEWIEEPEGLDAPTPLQAAPMEDVTNQDVAVEGDDTSVPVELDDNIKDDPPVQVIPVRPHNKKLVLSYIHTGGKYGKFVEIRNVSDTDYETKGLMLQFVRSNDLAGSSPDILASFYGTIRAGGRVVVGNKVAEDNKKQGADIYFSQTTAAVMAATGGALFLTDGIEELDSFCWAKDSKGVCGEDVYSTTAPNGAPIVTYARCFHEGVLVQCGDGLPFEWTEARRMEAGHGFVPFYNACTGLVVSEVAPKIIDQFIELYNPTEQSISLEKCLLQINTRVYQFSLEDGKIDSRAYLALKPSELGVSLARTTAGEVRVLASDGEIVDRFVYSTPSDDRSAMRVDDGTVAWTWSVTPGGENQYVQYLPCEAGYWRNEETGRCNKVAEPTMLADCGPGRERNPDSGRCRNIPVPTALKPCREGQYRSEETNRCRSIASVVSSLKPCRDDQFRNPATNRCKSIASVDDVTLADCGEGRERNPVTNRCRNILASTPAPADFAVEPIAESASVFIGWWVLAGIALLVIGYVGWEWREEIGRFIRRVGHVVSSRK